MNSRGRLVASFVGAANIVIVAAPASAQADLATQQYNLPHQDLGTSLRSVGRLSDTEIIFEPDVVAGRTAPSVQGNMTVVEAIERLLAGSGLSASPQEGAIIIHRRPNNDVGSDVHTTDHDIVVTGTHIRGAAPSAPVQTFERKDIEAQGFHDLGELARSIPQNFSGGQNPGVAGGGDQGVGNENSSSSSALNLRGLGPAATLTLLNGHRLAYDTVSQGVDLSQIPVAAIDRIEIVADGASALYGSDAVGGVANVILRRDYDGVLASARLAGSTDGGNTQQQYDVVTGGRWVSGGVMLAGSYSNISAITARQRDYTQNLDPSSTLVPWQRQVSAIAAGHQSLTPSLSLEFDTQFNRRLTELAAPTLTTADVRTDGLLSQPRVTSGTVNATLRWDIGAGWTLSAAGTYGVSNNHIFSRRFDAGIESYRTQLNYDNKVAVGEVGGEGPLFDMPGGEARLAVGGGYRHVGLDVFVTQTSGGNTATTSDIHSGRNVYYGYGELSLPFVGSANGRPWLRQLRLNAAGRYEDYPGNARLFTPKVGLVYAPADGLTLRADWGKSFKTQTLYQQYQARQGVLLPSVVFQSSPTNLPVLILAGGNPDLKPEKANTWSAGATLEPTELPGLTLEATYFNIRYRDRVVSPLTSLDDIFTNPIYRDYVTLFPSAANVANAVAALPQGLTNATGAPFDPAAVGAVVDSSLQNAARQKIQGADVSARYRVALRGDNIIEIEGTASYLDSNQQLSPGRPLLQMAGTIFNPPHWRGRFGGTWQENNVTLAAFGNYIGGTSDSRYTPTTHVASFTTLDVTGSVRSSGSRGMFASITVSASIQNLFNEKPAVIRNAVATDPPYDSTNYPVSGRVIGLTVSKAF